MRPATSHGTYAAGHSRTSKYAARRGSFEPSEARAYRDLGLPGAGRGHGGRGSARARAAGGCGGRSIRLASGSVITVTPPAGPGATAAALHRRHVTSR